VGLSRSLWFFWDRSANVTSKEAGKVGKEVHSRSGKDLPVGRPKRIFARQEVLELRKRGLSYRQIARRLGIGEGTVRRFLSTQ
jgi:putative DNA-invertase from lambdoid prophage Rac